MNQERNSEMNRRKFIVNGLAASAVAMVSSPAEANSTAPARSFKLNYAPHFGMFKNHTGNDLVTQLQFFREQGFTALEDNGLPERRIADQEKTGKPWLNLGLTMAVLFERKDFK